MDDNIKITSTLQSQLNFAETCLDSATQIAELAKDGKK